jgi:hypothetical protein
MVPYSTIVSRIKSAKNSAADGRSIDVGDWLAARRGSRITYRIEWVAFAALIVVNFL